MKTSTGICLTFIVLLSSCWSVDTGPRAEPAAAIPHIEAIRVPASVRVDQEAILEIDLSSTLDPLALSDGFLRAVFKSASSDFENSISNGERAPGKFFGLYVRQFRVSVQDTDLGVAASTIEIPLTFSEPGTHNLYFGHVRENASGGTTFTEKELRFDYPAESQLIEYLKVEVQVEP